PCTLQQDTERLFGMACSHMATVRGLSLSSEERLALYCLFKQATEGDCDEPRPGLIDLVGRAKWHAWHGCLGMDEKEAMRRYLVMVSDLCPSWLDEYEPSGGDIAGGQRTLEKDLQWEGDDEEEEKDGAGLGFGVTVSTLAAGQENTPEWGEDEEIFDAASSGDISKLKNLLEGGAKVDVQDEEGRTPLHFACDRGQAAVVALLLDLGAGVDSRDVDGLTPLANAVTCEHLEVVNLLVRGKKDGGGGGGGG
ncbi:unnamed protein product, partial [Discosporangium mesarthrocarpum]